jgi:uncharacterized protein DUF4154
VSRGRSRSEDGQTEARQAAFERRFTRRHWLTLALLVGASAPRLATGVEEDRVPARLQAELLAKVAAYDGKFLARARGRALVLVVVAPRVADSERFGAQIRAELAKQTRIGGVEHMEDVIELVSPADLARTCRQRQPAIVYLAPALSDAVPSIAEALAGLDLLSVSALASDVERGAVLGFDVLSGKPKLVVNLARARLQNVAFKPDLLRLARVLQ